jgi:hypothetical protein
MSNTLPNDPITGIADCFDGLTKREYFAAVVLGGLAADSTYVAGADKAAKVAVQYADALINALNEKK